MIYFKFIMSYKELAQKMTQKQEIIVQTSFDFPTSPDATVGGSNYVYSFASVLAQVEVELLTGKTKIIGLDQVVAAGLVVNPLGYKGQIEGGGVMALGYTLMEDSLMENGVYVSDNFDTYLIPTICEVPLKLNVEPIEKLDEEDSFGPRGVGEIGTVAVAPAIARAIFDATGCWINKLPISPEYLLKLINSRR